MPPWPLLCAAGGRHLGFLLNDPVVTPATGWGAVDAREVNYTCHCTRWKYEVIDWGTKETLSRSTTYGGGVLLETGTGSQREAKGVWLEQVEQRHADALARADELAALEERAAREEHAATRPKRRRTRRKPADDG